MCKYCDEYGCEFETNNGYMWIGEDADSPSGYSIYADNSYGEYRKVKSPIRCCPMCGLILHKEEG